MTLLVECQLIAWKLWFLVREFASIKCLSCADNGYKFIVESIYNQVRLRPSLTSLQLLVIAIVFRFSLVMLVMLVMLVYTSQHP